MTMASLAVRDIILSDQGEQKFTSPFEMGVFRLFDSKIKSIVIRCQTDENSSNQSNAPVACFYFFVKTVVCCLLTFSRKFDILCIRIMTHFDEFFPCSITSFSVDPDDIFSKELRPCLYEREQVLSTKCTRSHPYLTMV